MRNARWVVLERQLGDGTTHNDATLPTSTALLSELTSKNVSTVLNFWLVTNLGDKDLDIPTTTTHSNTLNVWSLIRRQNDILNLKTQLDSGLRAATSLHTLNDP